MALYIRYLRSWWMNMRSRQRCWRGISSNGLSYCVRRDCSMSPHLRNRGWLTRKLHRAWALPWTEWHFLIQTAILLPAIVLGLKLLPFKTLLALLQRRGTVACDAWGKGIVNPDRAAYLIDMVSRYHVLKPTCL